jgi:cytochrome P450
LIATTKIDGVRDLAAAYPLKVFPDAVGIERAGRENLLIYGNMVFNSFGPHTEIFTESARRMGPVTEWILAHCGRDKIADGGMGEAIYREVDDGVINADEAALLVRSLLSAGIDTTVAAIGNALHCFAEHPDQWDLLRRDPSQTKPAFEEVLRYTSPVQTFFRTTTEATEIGGVEIAENQKILVFMGAANRDPRRWDNPDVFDITRRPTGHLAFGTGVHRCVGQRIAQLEGEIILQKLAERVARIELAGPPVWRPNNTLHTLDSLPLRLVGA